ncbi:hypothetical protein EG68_11097 [Paragonimus skrjabini miyazakii]|uniref:Uncharacterized protein n=1 Tax=Paragonimus skrjabini miyazakii TaxID=59628 RepID=A0A8S9YK86_9TREM|nr:hypothetical protein EG68_11097 [Paragonimus skrjabini miyazakii]
MPHAPRVPTCARIALQCNNCAKICQAMSPKRFLAEAVECLYT